MAPQRKTFPRLFLARAEPFRLVGEQVFLRPPERGDYEEWASLRAASRNFLTPWEPSWPPDALSRATFRARLSRYGEDWRTDQGYNFFIFRSDETLAGGVGLSNLRRGVAETASLGYWIGEQFARQRHMSAALPLVLDFAFDPRPPVAHRLPRGRLCPQLPPDRRQVAGPRPLRDPARGLARLTGA
jgi:[ribosomal protein S5]-alanine N-acetyltransferase